MVRIYLTGREFKALARFLYGRLDDTHGTEVVLKQYKDGRIAFESSGTAACGYSLSEADIKDIETSYPPLISEEQLT